jgi:DNA-binding LytR/AlgR family response regulator
MRTLIIDDERPARRELRRLLAAFPWIDVIGECANIAEAKAAINSSSVALIFLDIPFSRRCYEPWNITQRRRPKPPPTEDPQADRHWFGAVGSAPDDPIH